MSKFTYDREADTVTMPAIWWRALALTHELAVGSPHNPDNKNRYIIPCGVLRNEISDAFLKDIVLMPDADINEFFALFEHPYRGAK